jgi:hypothetical protein
MRKRVLQKLPNAGEIAHRLRIETIDAFCASLARQLPVPAQFGVPPGIVEDAEALYREAASATLALLEDDAWAGPIGTLLAHLDNNVGTATTLLAAMLAAPRARAPSSKPLSSRKGKSSSAGRGSWIPGRPRSLPFTYSPRKTPSTKRKRKRWPSKATRNCASRSSRSRPCRPRSTRTRSGPCSKPSSSSCPPPPRS